MVVANGSLRFDAGTAASPVAEGLVQVAAETQQLLAENGAVLRACRAPGCVLHFAAPAAALGPGGRTRRPGAPAGVYCSPESPARASKPSKSCPQGPQARRWAAMPG